ncbi:MAG: hypothetical protein ACM3X9_04590, partial [Bacillota bacterium]
MKITESTVSMASLYQKEVTYSQSEKLREWRNGNREPHDQTTASNLPTFIQDQLQLSAEAKDTLKKSAQRTSEVSTEEDLYWVSD